MREIDLYGYFDYAASVPPYPEALQTFIEISGQFFGNPSGIHTRGKKVRQLLESAREKLGFYAQIVQKFHRTQFGEAGAKISLKILNQ